MSFDYEKVKEKFGEKYADELKERESPNFFGHYKSEYDKHNKKKRIRWFIMAILTLLVIIGGTYFIYVNWQIDKKVYSYYELAYAAGDAEQMSGFFTQLMENMEEEGMTEGHYALIFKTPRNDIGIDYQIFERLRDRSEHLHLNYDKGSFDYAETMDDVKLQMGKTGFSPNTWFLINKRLPIILLFGFITLLMVISLIYNCWKSDIFPW